MKALAPVRTNDVSLSDADIAHALELLSGLGALSHRKMMGGLSIYHDGTIFAMMDRSGRVFLKARDDFAAEMKAAGAVQFGADHGRRMPYWTMPEPALDDPELACDWARRALAALV